MGYGHFMVCLLFVHDYDVCVSVQTTLLRLCLCLWCYFAGAFANLPCFLSPWRRYFRESFFASRLLFSSNKQVD